ncbi:MAG: hypothetical protein H0X26_04285 [Alphaproteobacteria bacterium]|nr:hypothetical protein [Alphaproteobacteria bacterium]
MNKKFLQMLSLSAIAFMGLGNSTGVCADFPPDCDEHIDYECRTNGNTPKQCSQPAFCLCDKNCSDTLMECIRGTPVGQKNGCIEMKDHCSFECYRTYKLKWKSPLNRY